LFRIVFAHLDHHAAELPDLALPDEDDAAVDIDRPSEP
jgi:hypothetical protein